MGSEVIAVVERRRRWSAEEKLKVLIDALAPNASITAVSERHGVSRNLIYTWLRMAREGRMRGLSLGAKPAAAFVPVKIAPEPPAEPQRCALPPGGDPPRLPRRRTSSIEITLTNSRVVKADAHIDPEALARIVGALDSESGS